MDLDGKVAVVTGGASGIGRSTALTLAGAGCDVVIADLNESRMADVAGEVEKAGRRALPVRCDVTSDADVDGLAREALGAFGRVDVLMNNAGVVVLGPPERVAMDDWRWILDVNLFGIIRGVRAFAPHMVGRGSGHIVNTVSIAGLYAYSWDSSPYITSKFAAYGYTETLAVYLRHHGVGVSALCPGLVSTNLGENARFSGLDDPSGWVHIPEDLRTIDAGEVGPIVVDGIREGRFLILTHPEDAERIAGRRRDIDAAIAAQVAAGAAPPRLGA